MQGGAPRDEDVAAPDAEQLPVAPRHVPPAHRHVAPVLLLREHLRRAALAPRQRTEGGAERMPGVGERWASVGQISSGADGDTVVSWHLVPDGPTRISAVGGFSGSTTCGRPGVRVDAVV